MKKIFIILFLLCVVAHAAPSFAANAFDNAAEGPDNGGTTNSVTWNHNAGGTQRIGYVGCLGDNIGGADDLVTETWDGAPMVLDQKFTTPDGGFDRYTYLFFINAPSAGTKAIVIASTTNHYLLCASLSYKNAKQTMNPVESGVNSGSAIDLTTTTMTTVDNSWVIIIAQCGGCTSSTGIMERVRNNVYNNFVMGDSNGVVHPAGNYDMRTTGTTVGQVHITSTIQPDTGGGGTLPQDDMIFLEQGK